MKSLRSRKYFFLIIVSFFLLLFLFLLYFFFHSHIFSTTSRLLERNKFDKFTISLFQAEAETDPLALHFTLTSPENYGISDINLTFEPQSYEQFLASSEKNESVKKTLKQFHRKQLTQKQCFLYDVIKYNCHLFEQEADFYYYNEPFRATTGVQSELPILLSEYSFESEQDVTNYLTLLDSLDSYLYSLLEFEKQKASKNLFMTEFAAEQIIASLKAFQEAPADTLFIDSFQTRIQPLNLPDKKSEFYIRRNRWIVTNKIIPCYKNLQKSFEKLKKYCSDNGSLCNLPNGRKYYELLVQKNTGSSKSADELLEQIETQRTQALHVINTALKQHPKYLSQEPTLSFSEPKELLTYLSTHLSPYFPDASTTDFTLCNIDPSQKDFLAPAFYITAPIDDVTQNTIYLNKISDDLSLYTTLAHEGFPGHLYQTTRTYQFDYHPIQSTFYFPGYTEGWATYAELFSYRLLPLEADYVNYLQQKQSFILSLYATIDLMVHDKGWTLKEVTDFLSEFGIRDTSTCQDIYQLVIEEPAHYLKYYVGYLELLDLKNYATKKWQKEYSDYRFHKRLLELGPAPFPILKKYL